VSGTAVIALFLGLPVALGLAAFWWAGNGRRIALAAGLIALATGLLYLVWVRHLVGYNRLFALPVLALAGGALAGAAHRGLVLRRAAEGRPLSPRLRLVTAAAAGLAVALLVSTQE
jgi:hypothetical protein